jgi:hypothetical protein
MVQEKKKMENQLIRHNPDFYEKEIKRLRGEVEKLQEFNEDHKYKLMMA